MKVYVDRLRGEESQAAIRLLEYAIKDEYGIKMPGIVRDRYGKPSFNRDIGVYFSLSHSGGYIICALSSTPVGVDIQEIREVSPHTLTRICTERELSNLDFMSLWCLKESFIKLKGRLDRAYKEIEFLPGGEIFKGPEESSGRLLMTEGNYRIAVCGVDHRETEECVVCNLF